MRKTLDLFNETHSLTRNESGHATGWLPGALSNEGKRLAAEMGARYGDARLDAVYVSDLGRAVDTAGIAFASTTVPVFEDTRLRECNYGELNGMPVARLRDERAKRLDVPYPGGESYREVVGRTRDFLAQLLRERNGQRILVISHSANKWALDHLLLGTAMEEMVAVPFAWQEGWRYEVSATLRGS